MRLAGAALSVLDRFWRDIRQSLRVFSKNPAFTCIAVLSIAFGTGANVAMFSAADALILRPLPIQRPAEVVTAMAPRRLVIKAGQLSIEHHRSCTELWRTQA